jgi:hypothetical protein
MTGMNDNVSNPQPLVCSTVGSTTRPGEAAPATSDPEQERARPVGPRLEGRLADLTQGAITSRSLARQYLRTARRFVAAARQAQRTPDRAYYEAHLSEARKAHDQARKCLSFARLCQKRAECLAVIGGYPSSSGE